MIVRSEHVLGLLLPAIVVSWVIADTAGLVTAEWDVAAAMPTVHIISANQKSFVNENTPSRATVTMCSSYGSVATDIVAIGYPQTTLHRLCQAGLKFSFSLPKT